MSFALTVDVLTSSASLSEKKKKTRGDWGTIIKLVFLCKLAGHAVLVMRSNFPQYKEGQYRGHVVSSWYSCGIKGSYFIKFCLIILRGFPEVQVHGAKLTKAPSSRDKIHTHALILSLCVSDTHIDTHTHIHLI